MKTENAKTIIILLIFVLSSFLIAEEGFNLLATMSGDSVGDEFNIVAGVGDVNGDGYPDVLVGAPGGEYAKLYFGGAPFDTVADLIFTDEKEYTRFGCSVAGDGDVNGDGYPDIVIGASSTWVGPSWPDRSIYGAGAAYVYFGGTDMDTIPDLELVVGNWDEQIGWHYEFGYSVSFAGDINNDGYDDIAIGAPNDDYDAHGRVYIYYGDKDMDEEYDVLLEGEDHFDNFGWSISDAGDVNRDGFEDVLIGTPQLLSDNPGKAYLVYGNNKIGLATAEVFVGDTAKYSYGRWVSGLRDVNGDGYDDFGIMSDNYFKVISGKTLKSLCEISTNSDWAAFQFISGGGDINSDSICDIFVGVQNKAAQYAGMMAIYLGSSDLDTIPTYKIIGHSPYQYFGCSIDFASDLNNDGYKEIIIGEHQCWGEDGPGRVYIYSFGIEDNVEERKIIHPGGFHLYQNYPNPFNASTKITYCIPTPGRNRLFVYDIAGREVAVLIDKYQISGTYSICWDAAQHPSGIYVYKLLSENKTVKTKKMLLIK